VGAHRAGPDLGMVLIVAVIAVCLSILAAVFVGT
jgi:hypothetical protein